MYVITISGLNLLTLARSGNLESEMPAQASFLLLDEGSKLKVSVACIPRVTLECAHPVWWLATLAAVP
ncbi:hypothetical protein TNCV_1625201 [Trichonephila clavipes]|nr:hypothetical protein TNCV_1625201 [Trichonephila clavipes]